MILRSHNLILGVDRKYTNGWFNTKGKRTHKNLFITDVVKGNCN